MPKPRVLIAAVTAAPAAILSAHLKTVQAAATNSKADCDFLYLIDPSCPQAKELYEIAEAAGISAGYAGEKAPEAAYSVSEHTHHWSEGAFYWLAAQKEELLKIARDDRYDYLWLTDSDLILGKDTLSSLLACSKPVVSAVFHTRWSPNDPPLPQVWLSHPYGFEGMGMESHDFLRRLAERDLVQVRGLGACTLIRADALQKVSFRPVPNLPREGMWQGEDRAFCINAERAHVELWADAWPDIFHCYRPSDEALIPEALELMISRDKIARGRLVSFTLEPLEEPQLASHIVHVRGRMGELPLLPSLEKALLHMNVGEERLLPIDFPAWYPLAPYRSQKRLVRVRLLGTKPFMEPLPNGLSSGLLA